MKGKLIIYGLAATLAFAEGCTSTSEAPDVVIFETSAAGHKLSPVNPVENTDHASVLELIPEQKFQTILGFGGAFTESSAWLFSRLSQPVQDSVIRALFGQEGARYSLTRTHINSCDFSLKNYAYDTVAGDTALEHFSIAEDLDDIIPMIHAAQKVSAEGFKLIASPWTAPPWMKDNNHWIGGKLLPEYYPVWARYFVKYLESYRQEGIEFWGVTAENEPLGNGNNWESMHFTPGEMKRFIDLHLGPQLRENGWDVKIHAYDQNRGRELEEWASHFYDSDNPSEYTSGFAVHWYNSTYDVFEESLELTHRLAPEKHLIQTEACVDAEVPHWRDDTWYWSKEATDWGWDWAPEEQRYLHPKYVPVFRYARDIIGCLNHWVEGWIDWNMLLDRQGGPNWAGNWCVAPIIIDPEQDQVYFTPLYYTMAHFSRFIRPGAVRTGIKLNDENLLATAVENPDGSRVVVIFNPGEVPVTVALKEGTVFSATTISAKAIQTVIITIN
ncbi:MAG: glycoside hydrolase family 30 protein [Bacteroidales bacterium]